MKKKAFTAPLTSKFIIVPAILLPLFVYYLLVYLFAVNIPLSDDFSNGLGFLNSFLSLDNSYDRLRLVFSQFNEHRLAVNRLLTLAVLKINGVLDFRVVILLGNLMLLPALYAVYASFKKKNEKIKYFLPAVFIIAVPQYSGSIFWATSVVQNISCLAFSLLALAFLKKDNLLAGLAAFVFAVLSVFSSATGLLVLPVALVLLLLEKRKKAALWWSVATLFVLTGYFYGYTSPAHYKEYYTANYLAMVEFFFAFLGSPVILNVFYMKGLFGVNADIIIRLLSILAGTGITVYFLFLLKKKYYKTNPVIFSMFLLFLITAGAAAVTRSGVGLQAFVSRYRIIPVFMFALVYLSFMEINKEKVTAKYYKYLLILAITFFSFSYLVNIPEIRACRSSLIFGITNWQKDKRGMERLYGDPVYAERQLSEAIERGLYLPPE